MGTSYGRGRSAFEILTDKSIGKRPLGRLWHKWEDNIKMDLKEINMNTRNWVDSAQGGIIGEAL